MEMTELEIRIEMAKCCGWKVERTHTESAHAQWSLINPEGKIVVDGIDEADCWNQFHLYPYYPADLNAMNEAEKILDDKDSDTRSLWLDHLGVIVGWNKASHPAEARFECKYLTARSSARQRAEAFLKVLGRWKEEQ